MSTGKAMAAARPHHRAPPGRVPTRCVAALCTACFLLGVCVVNRFAFSPQPNPLFLPDFSLSAPHPPPISSSRRELLQCSSISWAEVVMFALLLQLLGGSRATRLSKQGNAPLRFTPLSSVDVNLVRIANWPDFAGEFWPLEGRAERSTNPRSRHVMPEP